MDISEIIKPETINPNKIPAKEKNIPPPLPEDELVYYRDYVLFESKLLNDTFIFPFARSKTFAFRRTALANFVLCYRSLMGVEL